ncbi:hypothetical protein ABWH98_08630 [Labrenzia sp. ac12]|uniref:hypothetical protein n=1 Tax=unclassified Labrenzia TaxID=2648686 RepID=UPI001267A547|nr:MULTISPECIES: hypothetical protein [unclassified Labrenzia]QFS98900.1 hypothetical protein FIV06_15840 [Labrenzia sp. THAF191b]QFT05214.1 hypothetical protein FIV05_15835 [Labrenzia sp. THAF191a]QFT16758.1 hypothetical protein FIV03_15850 [Labrenzia sp. THAF187b]
MLRGLGNKQVIKIDRSATHCLLTDLSAYDKHVEGKRGRSLRFMGCSTREDACFTKCVEISAVGLALHVYTDNGEAVGTFP